MSVWKNRPDGKTVRRNRITAQFAWLAIDALELTRLSGADFWRIVFLPGYRSSTPGRRPKNGKLPVTFKDFADFGIHRNAIAPAIREAEALVFIRVTQYGVASNAEFRIPNKFALAHLPTDDGQTPATNAWRRFKTIEDAIAAAKAARTAPARYGKFARRPKTAKTDLRYGNRSEDGYGKRIQNPEMPNMETVPLSPSGTVLLSISRGGADTSVSNNPPEGLCWSRPLIGEVFGEEAARLRAQCEVNGTQYQAA